MKKTAVIILLMSICFSLAFPTFAGASSTESELKEAFKTKVSADYKHFKCGDYDADGAKEAFVIVNGKDTFADDIWFVNSDGNCSKIVENTYGTPNDDIVVSNGRFFVWQISAQAGSLLLLGVKNGQAFEPTVSRRYTKITVEGDRFKGYNGNRMNSQEKSLTYEPSQREFIRESASDYANAYADFLENGTYLQTNRSPSDYTFALGYLDDDEVPELILFDIDQSHFAGAYLYAFAGGKIVDLNITPFGFYGEWGLASFAFKQGCIWDYYMQQGSWSNDYYYYSAGNVSLIKNFSGSDGYGSAASAWHKIDGKDVTSEESSAEIDKLQNKYTFTTVRAEDGFEINGYNLSALRENASSFVIGPAPSQTDKAASLLDTYLSMPSTSYDSGLALISAKLCQSTYAKDGGKSDESVRTTLHELGFESESIYSNNYNGGSLAYTVAVRDYNGADSSDNMGILVIVARGSTNAYELIKDATALPSKKIKGLGNYRIYDIVGDFYNDINKTVAEAIKNDTKHSYYKVLVTGHSLGGAAANLVAAYYNTMPRNNKNDIFCYTFGAINSIDTNAPVISGFENIHNIYNWLDTFSPYQYGKLLPTGMGRGYGKFGYMCTFTYDFRTASQKKENTIGQISSSVNHGMDNYVKYVQAVDEKKASILTGEVGELDLPQYSGCYVVACPVDVEVYRDGELVGRVVNQALDDAFPTKDILVADDVKYIFFADEHAYDVKLSAFGSGEMSVFMQELKEDGETRAFTDVSLIPGKQMESQVGLDVGIRDTHIYVLDDEGTRILEIRENGTEHELNLITNRTKGSITLMCAGIVTIMLIIIIILVVTKQKNHKENEK